MYCQDNETSWLDWSRLKRDNSLFQYVKTLIAFRKAHPSLRQKYPLTGTDRNGCGLPDVSYHGENAWQVPAEVYSRQLGVLYCAAGEEEDYCFIAYNMHWLKHSFALPALPKNREWHRVIGTEEDAAGRQEEDQKRIELQARSIVVLTGEQKAAGKAK